VTSRRSIRTRPRNGLAISDVLASALLSELLSPSPELWLVSGWVTDVAVIDNSVGQFDCVLGPEPRSQLSLSEVLGLLASSGTELHIALHDNDHNLAFIERLRGQATGPTLHTYLGDALHEKTLVGWSWLLKGSMNFTWNGTQRNEEGLDFVSDRAVAAQERFDLRTRWIGGAS